MNNDIECFPSAMELRARSDKGVQAKEEKKHLLFCLSYAFRDMEKAADQGEYTYIWKCVNSHGAPLSENQVNQIVKILKEDPYRLTVEYANNTGVERVGDECIWEIKVAW